MAVDYLGGIITSIQDDNEALPIPSDMLNLKADEYSNGFTSLIKVDIEKYRKEFCIKNIPFSI